MNEQPQDTMAAILRYRIALGFVFAAIFVLMAEPTKRAVVMGIPITLLGLATRVAATGIIFKNKKLARVGPYRISRNPLYLGSFLIGLGVTIMGARPLVTLLYIAVFLYFYLEKIKREETKLARLFGEEYAAYCREVPRLFPNRLPLAQLREDIRESFDWAQVGYNKEYNAVAGVYAITILMLLLV